jgi:REP element-mobilizing transposase RayT
MSAKREQCARQGQGRLNLAAFAGEGARGPSNRFLARTKTLRLRRLALKTSAFSVISSAPPTRMTLAKDAHQTELRAAGWHSRGYLPHFDGRALPQFITLHLADSVPKAVIERWKQELGTRNSSEDKILLQGRIEKYADRGYGKAFLKDHRLAEMFQETLLRDDGKKYQLTAWVVMPNHLHVLATRFEIYTLSDIMQSFKSLTSHKANKILRRSGQFWMPDYFDRYIRTEEHYTKTVEYIENNPVKARLCPRPEEYPFSSAWFRAHVSR